jgi:hypothetical protein
MLLKDASTLFSSSFTGKRSRKKALILQLNGGYSKAIEKHGLELQYSDESDTEEGG